MPAWACRDLDFFYELHSNYHPLSVLFLVIRSAAWTGKEDSCAAPCPLIFKNSKQ